MSSENRENRNPGAVPETEPERQYYFIRECRKIVKKKEAELGRPLTACCVTFGCQMNARDSEKLRGILEEIGYRNTDKEEADLVLYNTCTVRENANTRVYGRLGYLHSLKDRNPHMIIGLCGCMMQEQQVVDRLKKSFRFVDLIFGTHNVYKLAELLYRVFEDQGMVVDILQKTDQVVEELPTDRK